VDALTRRMAGAWRTRTRQDPGYRGFHQCTSERCYARSDNHDYFVATADGERLMTNSLAIHYLAHHREELPFEELAKVARLPAGDAEPTTDELAGRDRPRQITQTRAVSGAITRFLTIVR